MARLTLDEYTAISNAAGAAEAQRIKFRKLGLFFGINAAAAFVILPALASLSAWLNRYVPGMVNAVGAFIVIYFVTILPSLVLGFVFMAKGIKARGERDRFLAATSQPSAK